MSELKPCPFCGEKPILQDGDYRLAHLRDCYIATSISHEVQWFVGKRVIRLWNTRVGETDDE